MTIADQGPATGLTTRRDALVFSFVSLALLFAPAADASEAGPIVTPVMQSFDLSQLAGGLYALDKNHATITFQVGHLGFSAYTGRFDGFDAEINFVTDDPELSTLSATIDAASIDTNHEILEGHLRGADFFNVDEYPEISFTSTKVERTGERTGQVTGDLTLLGVTKPVTLDVTFNGGALNPMAQKDALGFSARGQIKRSDFGMRHLVPNVGDTVGLIIEAEFHRQTQ